VTCEVGLSRSVRAFHIMPGLPGPEGQLHDHDYRVEIVVEREELRPAEAEAVTVEVFARWVHDTLSPAVAAAGGESLAVRVWETPVAFGGYRARC
jgi:6-pyruvoyltetrahydropterin/6-carboxytetrahydropterin synthase